jgi:hypothetical protein
MTDLAVTPELSAGQTWNAVLKRQLRARNEADRQFRFADGSKASGNRFRKVRRASVTCLPYPGQPTLQSTSHGQIRIIPAMRRFGLRNNIRRQRMDP